MQSNFWNRFSIFCLVALLSGWEEKALADKTKLLKEETINLGEPSTKATPLQDTHQPHPRAPILIRQGAARLLTEEGKAHPRLSSHTLYEYDNCAWNVSKAPVEVRTQLETWYNLYKNNALDKIEKRYEEFLKIEKMGRGCPIKSLIGKRGVSARRNIKPDTIVGFYVGVYCGGAESEALRLSCDQTIEWRTQKRHQITRKEHSLYRDVASYTFVIFLRNKKKLMVSAYGHGVGNALSVINSWRGPEEITDNKVLENISYKGFRFGNEVPAIAVQTKTFIPKGATLWGDYGADYWEPFAKLNPCSHRKHLAIESSMLANCLSDWHEGQWLTDTEIAGIYCLQRQIPPLPEVKGRFYYDLQTGKKYRLTKEEKVPPHFVEKKALKETLLVDSTGWPALYQGNMIRSCERGQEIRPVPVPIEDFFIQTSQSASTYQTLDQVREYKGKGILRTYATWRRQKTLVTEDGFRVRENPTKRQIKQRGRGIRPLYKHRKKTLPPDQNKDQLSVHLQTGQCVTKENPLKPGEEETTYGKWRKAVTLVDQNGTTILTLEKAKELGKSGQDVMAYIEGLKEEAKRVGGKILTQAAYNHHRHFVNPQTGEPCASDTPGAITKTAWHLRQKKRSHPKIALNNRTRDKIQRKKRDQQLVEVATGKPTKRDGEDLKKAQKCGDVVSYMRYKKWKGFVEAETGEKHMLKGREMFEAVQKRKIIDKNSQRVYVNSGVPCLLKGAALSQVTKAKEVETLGNYKRRMKKPSSP